VFPAFWVDYLEIPGTSYANAETRYTFRIQEQENLWEYYNVLIQRLRNYADNPFRMGENGFAYEDETQIDALREGLVNMLMHADYFGTMHPTVRVYSNRIEFQNPGRFVIDITKRPIRAISKPRNPILARFFRWAKLAENAGFGFDKMFAWKNKVNFETQIDFSETVFELEEDDRANILDTPIVTPIVTPIIAREEQNLLHIIDKNNKVTREELANDLKVSINTVKTVILRLKKKGVLERIGNNRTGYWNIIDK
jgi:ATP-dependent DNA helicase RecG